MFETCSKTGAGAFSRVAWTYASATRSQRALRPCVGLSTAGGLATGFYCRVSTPRPAELKVSQAASGYSRIVNKFLAARMVVVFRDNRPRSANTSVVPSNWYRTGLLT